MILTVTFLFCSFLFVDFLVVVMEERALSNIVDAPEETQNCRNLSGS